MAGSLWRMGGGLRLAARVLRAQSGSGATTGVRRASGEAHVFKYRHYVEPPPAHQIKGEVLSALMWFWILWNFWHDPDVVLGHFPYPDASQWTDEELGIPPDDEE
ncbi:Complex I-AGGG [Podarcis lilfordi]|uniref:NADH dehydrogenase [ubiquinone] 1 beta subcomplex subunit 2, mitochondrial n=2 Tax=Podarcis TaxID=42163 RepID=A0AA35PER8_9SAUR|nr:NADH dehydrogenase [ubiquinone] 1 beta subcomplex subunit 2, mitochondrial [Podarcis muralis]CAI5786251.1 Complex I-AGGG [Podarcis lilfordi]